MILALTISPSVLSIVVMVAAVPTTSVTAIPVKLRLSALRVVMCAVVNVA